MAAVLPPVAAVIPPAAYVPVGDNVVIADGITEEDSVKQILYWIGFTIAASRNILAEDAFASFSDIRVLSEKDITSLVTDMGSRNQANGRIHVGTRRAKRLKALVHWVQDFYRVSAEPSIVGLESTSFKLALETSLSRAVIRKSLKNTSDTSAKAADPGELKSEKQWKEWEEKFTNFLGCLIGVTGIPLSYVIRENDNPDYDGDHPNFVSKTIACAPLNGEFYLADRQTVFNLIISFTTGQPSGDWIKDTLRYNDGRRSMKKLRDHFAGEGNASRNKAVADRLKESLHYSSERALSFEKFLTSCQKMFNIYEKEGEEMPEDAKLRFLFTKVKHQGLKAAIEALKAQRTAGTEVTYTMAANHLSTAVSELPEIVARNRNISATGSENSNKKGSPIIYNEDGSIKTGFITGWRNLSKADKKIVLDEKKRLGIKPGNKSWKRGQSNVNSSDANRMHQLEDQVKTYKRQIKAYKRLQSGDESKSDNEESFDAGDQFGGKASKKKQKN